MNTKHKRKAHKIYHQYRYKPIAFLMGVLFPSWLITGLICFGMLEGLHLIPPTEDWHLLGYPTLIVTLLMAFMVGSFIYIATHEDGLEYRIIFHHIIISWKNLSHLKVYEGSDGDGGTTYQHFLYLKDHPSKLLDVGAIVPIRHKRGKTDYYIDVDFLLNTPFGKDLQQYAPHVIETAREAEDRAKAS